LNPIEIQDFCRRYFQAVDAPILRDEEAYLQVQLPRDVDKELIERPFYWKWVETIGQEVAPTIMNLVFKQDRKVEGETRLHYVALGNIQLERIFQSCRNRGRIVRLFEKKTGKASNRVSGSTLIPYFIANIKISYISDLRRDVFTCDAIEMESGKIFHNVWEQLIARNFVITLDRPSSLTGILGNPYHHILHELALDDVEFWKMQCQSAWEDLKDCINARIQEEDHTWAKVAIEELELDRKQLQSFYENLIQNAKDEETKTIHMAERETRLAELTWRRQPKIEIIPFNIGLLYLQTPLKNG
jgi:hypothetical protein